MSDAANSDDSQINNAGSALPPEMLEALEQVANYKKTTTDFLKEITAAKESSVANSNDITDKQKLISGIYSATQASQSSVAEIENEVRGKRGAIDADIKAIGDTKIRFDAIKDQAEKTHGELLSKQTDLQNQITDITAKLVSLSDLEKTLISHRDSAEAAKNQAEGSNQAIQAQQQSFQTSIAATTEKLSELTKQQESLAAKIKEIKETHAEVIECYNELLADESDEQGNIVKKSVDTKVKNLLSEITSQYAAVQQDRKSANEKFEKLYVELSAKISSLLPGAGAAGLASSYHQAKMRYAVTDDVLTDADKIREAAKAGFWSKVGRFLAGYIPQRLAYFFNLSLFLGPLAGIVYMFYPSNFTYPDLLSGNPYAVLLYKLTLTLPLVAISTYGIMQISSIKKLYEDYNHKQRVMQLYHSFKAEIDATNDPELKGKLLNIMLDVVRDKPTSKAAKADAAFMKSLIKPLEAIANKITE